MEVMAMLITLAAGTLALAFVIVAVLALLLASIRREGRSPRLACRPPTPGTALARRLCGLYVRR
jgi:hypothetical protein